VNCIQVRVSEASAYFFWKASKAILEKHEEDLKRERREIGEEWVSTKRLHASCEGFSLAKAAYIDALDAVRQIEDAVEQGKLSMEYEAVSLIASGWPMSRLEKANFSNCVALADVKPFRGRLELLFVETILLKDRDITPEYGPGGIYRPIVMQGDKVSAVVFTETDLSAVGQEAR